MASGMLNEGQHEKCIQDSMVMVQKYVINSCEIAIDEKILYRSFKLRMSNTSHAIYNFSV